MNLNFPSLRNKFDANFRFHQDMYQLLISDHGWWLCILQIWPCHNRNDLLLTQLLLQSLPPFHEMASPNIVEHMVCKWLLEDLSQKNHA